MKKTGQFRSLVKELSRDPRLKQVISKAKHQSRGRNTGHVENLRDFFLLSLGITSRFVSKKKARILDELMDAVYLLVEVSLLLKENVFDRPEVKKFLNQGSKQVFLFAQVVYKSANEYVSTILSKSGHQKSRHA